MWLNKKTYRMYNSVTVEIINEGAMNLLRDMEQLRLIRVNGSSPAPKIDWNAYNGAMTKQSIAFVEEQLVELRNAWE